MISVWWAAAALAGPCDIGAGGADAWVQQALEASDGLVEKRSRLSGDQIARVVALVEQGPALPVRVASIEEGSGWPPVGTLAMAVDRRGEVAWGPPLALLGRGTEDGPVVVVSVDATAPGARDAQMLSRETSAGARLMRHRALVAWPTRDNVGLVWNTPVPVAAAQVAAGRSLTEALRTSLAKDTVLLLASRTPEGVGFCALSQDGEAWGHSPAEPWEALSRPGAVQALAQRGLDVVVSEELASLPDVLPLPPSVAAVVGEHRNVLVFGPGSLVRAPFLALPLQGREEPLVTTHTVQIVSSLGELLIPARRWARPRRGVVVSVAEPPPASGLASIPAASEEARRVAARIPLARRLTDEQATRDAVTSALRTGEGVLHVAAHGRSSTDDPVRGSGVWLAGPRGLLNVADIMSLDLSRYDLVVLSACDTGTGQDLEGGVISLARGFLIAGAPVVIASRKPVGDVSTRELMDALYQHLMRDPDRPPPAEALRRAMVDRQRSAPLDLSWADFFVFRR